MLLSVDGVGTNEIMCRTGRFRILRENRWGKWAQCHSSAPRFSVGIRHALKRLSILASFCQPCNYKSLSIIAVSSAVGMSHRRLEWQTFAGIALAVHSGPSPVIV